MPTIRPGGRTAIRTCLVVGAACLAVTPGASIGQALPPIVKTEIQDATADCAPEKVTLQSDFVTRKDVNGDGVADVVLDYGSFTCGRSAGFYCGSAGCRAQVFASLRGGSHVKVLDENVRVVTFETLRGRPAMLVGYHGAACGKIGVAPCSARFVWNGETFARIR